MMKTDLRLRRLRSCCARSGLGFLSSGGGAELAAGLRDAGAAGGAVGGVVVVPTGPLLLLGLDAVVCASPRPFRAVTFVAGAVGTMWKLAVCRWDGSDAVLLWEIV